ATKGKMTDIDAGKYANITSSGTMQVNNLHFVSKDLPQGMKVSSAQTTFNNEKIQVQHLKGHLGKSDIQVNGTISNYMGYLFADNQPLRGTMNLSSTRFDVNEWMVDEFSGEQAATPSEGVVAVPENLDFVLQSSIGQVLYTNLKLDNLRGQVTIRDQVAKLDKVSFNTLGGRFVTTGSYNTKDLQHPLFSFGLDVQNLDFKSAYNTFNTIKALVPISRLLDGQFSTNFNFAGELGKDMMPVFSTLTGKGVVEVVKAIVTDMRILDQISTLTNLQEVKNLVVEHKNIGAEIVGGNLVIKPFDIQVKDIKMTVGGTNGIDGKIAYVTSLDVPTGKVGNALQTKLTSLTGVKDIKGTDRVTLNLNIGGTLTAPKVSLASSSAKGQAKAVVQSVVQSKLADAKEQLAAKRVVAQDSLKKVLEARRVETEAKAKEEIEKKRKEAEERLRSEAKNKLNNLFSKPKKPVTQPEPAKTDSLKK
ncbi:MAG: AsmA-like C-terminal region-containing protein, partial [Adhaeribacter sp.]